MFLSRMWFSSQISSLPKPYTILISNYRLLRLEDYNTSLINALEGTSRMSKFTKRKFKRSYKKLSRGDMELSLCMDRRELVKPIQCWVRIVGKELILIARDKG